MTHVRVVGGVRRGIVLGVLAAALLAGCGGESGSRAEDGEGAAGGSDGTALAGTITAFITHAEADAITFDEIEVLSGEEAAAARETDGEPSVDEGLDVPYLRNTTREAYEVLVASDVHVQVFDCAGGCELVDWPYEDLVIGAPLPYGTVDSPFTLTVHDGEVVEITEIYLP